MSALSNSSNLDLMLCQNNPPLRQRRQRTNFDDESIAQLDKAFTRNPYPDINEREQLARELKTTEDRIQVWFQNKRARYRKRVQKENKNNSTKESSLKPKQSQEMNETPKNKRINNLSDKFTDKTNLSISSSTSLNDSAYSSMLLPNYSLMHFNLHSTPIFSNHYMPYYHQPILDNSLDMLSTNLDSSLTGKNEEKKTVSLFKPYE